MLREPANARKPATSRMPRKHLAPRAAAVFTIAALAIALCEVVLADRAATAPIYTLTPVEFGMQLKTPDGRVVFEYLTRSRTTSASPLPAPPAFIR